MLQYCTQARSDGYRPLTTRVRNWFNFVIVPVPEHVTSTNTEIPLLRMDGSDFDDSDDDQSQRLVTSDEDRSYLQVGPTVVDIYHSLRHCFCGVPAGLRTCVRMVEERLTIPVYAGTVNTTEVPDNLIDVEIHVSDVQATESQVAVHVPAFVQLDCIPKFLNFAVYLERMWEIFRHEKLELHSRVATLMLAHGMGSNHFAIIRYWLKNLGAPRQLIAGFFVLMAMPLTLKTLVSGLAYLLQTTLVFAASHAFMLGVLTLGLYFLCHAPAHYYFYKVTAVIAQDFDDINLSLVGGILTEELGRERKRLSPSHKVLCRNRDSFIAAVPRIAQLFGRRPYFVGLSRRSAAAGFVGISQFSADALEHLNAPQLYARTNDLMSHNDLLVFQDTDYYLDMNDILMLGMPCLMYTFVPESAGQSEEMTFCFDSDNRVVGKVHGGKKFAHKIWSYGDDLIHVTKWGYKQSYKVYSYNYMKHHMVRLLIPIGYSFSTTAYSLAHETYVNNMCVVVKTDIISLGIVGLPTSIETSCDVWTAILATVTQRSIKREEHSVIKSDINVACKPFFANPAAKDYEITKTIADFVDKIYPYIVAYIGESDVIGLVGQDIYARQIVTETPEIEIDDSLGYAATYQFDDHTGDVVDRNEERIAVREICPPFIPSAVCPVLNSATSVRDMIDKRIVRPQLTSAEATDLFDSEIFGYMYEIIRMVFPVPLTPVDDTEVEVRMKTASQRNHREEWENSMQFVASTVFVKDESYGDTKAFRPVTVNNGTAKWELARYIYAIMDYLKGHGGTDEASGARWFIPGKSPEAIAEIVAAVAQKATAQGKGLVKTDYVKWDGSVGAIIRCLIFLVLDAVFPGLSVDLLNDHTYGAPVKVKMAHLESIFGSLFFHPGFSLGSGNQITSFLGCFGNMFIAYYYLRTVEKLSSEEAYACLGCYMGDDGLTAASDCDGYVGCAKKMGCTLEAEPCTPDNPVQFLSRYYSPEVYHGRLDSCCDIKRQLQKITFVDEAWAHDPLKHHWLKTQGYLLTDSNTPFVGAYCKLVEALCGPLHYKLPFDPATAQENDILKAFGKRTDYLSHLAMECYVHKSVMPNNNDDGWMDAILERACPDFDFDGASTWALGFPIPKDVSLKTNADRKAYQSDVRKLLKTHPMFCSDTEVVPKPCADKDIILSTCGDSVIIPSTSNVTQAPVSTNRPPVNMQQELGLRITADLLRANPWDFKAGGLKCMLVNYLFFEDVRKIKREKGKRSNLVYTGSMGDTDLHTAKLFSNTYGRIEFFDMGYNTEKGKPRVAELNKYVVVRSTAFNMKEAKATREKADYVFWNDDMFAGDQKNRAQFNDTKCGMLEAMKPDYALIKIMRGCTSFVPVGDSVRYFRTPQKAPFHAVNELRCSLSWPCSFEKKDVDTIEAVEMPLWEGAVKIDECDDYLGENPGKLRPPPGVGKAKPRPDDRANKSRWTSKRAEPVKTGKSQ